jgi:hypothetical protein
MTEVTPTTPVQPDYSPAEFQMKLAEWREKARNNQLTVDEMREAILFLRAGRVHAAVAKATRTKAAGSSSPRTLKEKAAAVDSDALLGDLGI